MTQEWKGKKLLVLGGPLIAGEIVKAAQAKGAFVGVTDWYPLEKSPAKKMADAAFYISTADVDAVVRLIQEEKYDGVITGYTDSTLPYYAAICEKAGVPGYLSPEQAKIVINKDLFKDACRRNGVPVVPEYEIDFNQPTDLEKIDFPIIIKPVDNSGSRGISICHNAIEFGDMVNKALALSEAKKVLVEKYLTGQEVVMYYTVQDGEAVLTAICDRFTSKEQKDAIQLPLEYKFPSAHTAEIIKKYNENICKLFKNLKIHDGPIFVQAFYQDNQLYVYEMGFRLNGAQEYQIVNRECGINNLEMTIRYALTGKMSEDEVQSKADPHFRHCYSKLSPLIRLGEIGKIEGIAEIEKLPQTIAVVMNHQEGDLLTQAHYGTLMQIVCRIFLEANNEAEMEAIKEKIRRLLKVKNSEGEEMLLAF